MKIRSITAFADLTWPLAPRALDGIGHFLETARQTFEHEGWEVQTTRLASQPCEHLLADRPVDELVALARRVDEVARELAIGYVSLGPVTRRLKLAAAIPPAIAATETVFLAISLTPEAGQVSLEAAAAAGHVIAATAAATPSGFGNLRFAAIANCPPAIPFFPVAYHAGGLPVCAVALEAADLAVEAFAPAGTLDEARQRLVSRLGATVERVARLAGRLAGEAGFVFGGVDLSLAPFPEEARSIGHALERLGVGAIGGAGTLFAAAFLTSCLAGVAGPRTGYSGLMLPLLEDATLAARSREGLLTVNDLLLYSAVCGLGLDTVPLPGEATADELAALLLDVAALAARLDKPLTARLLPVPGKRAGETTDFAFSYFAPGAVLPLKGVPSPGLFARGPAAQLVYTRSSP